MATIVLSPSNVVASPRVGGHFWVYLHYALGLRALGCDVYWLEEVAPTGDADADAARLALFHDRMCRFGLGDRYLLYTSASGRGEPAELVTLNRPSTELDALVRRADLLLNFHYEVDPGLLARFRRTALVDIDPGLLQFWMARGQLRVAPHDRYLSIGETVGTPGARFPDCGFAWTRIRSPIWLPAWPAVSGATARSFTTVSSWWGGLGGGEWAVLGEGDYYDNNKRVSFLDYLELPRRTAEPLELALALSDGVPIDAVASTGESEPAGEGSGPADRRDYPTEAQDMELLRRYGWRLRHARDVAGSPEAFQAYVQQSRGEFSCAKPSCMAFQNAWVSDRTLCYLASGKPVVVQDTGPSAFLPDGLGMFRFRSLEQAAEALAAVAADYEKQSRAAREIAEAYFDARAVLPPLLDAALHGG